MQQYYVFEECPHCGHEICVKWNVADMGYQIYCPVCGKVVMLCSECRQGLNVPLCNWNNDTNRCFRSKNTEDVERTKPESTKEEFKDKWYIMLEDSLFFKHFCFWDIGQMLSDRIFAEMGLRVWRRGEYVKDDGPWVVVICKVRKRDYQRFVAAMHELKKRVTLCGYPHYVEEVSGIIDEIYSKKTELYGD